MPVTRDPTIAEACSEIGCSRAHLYALLGRGELTAYRITERQTRIDRAALDAYIASRRSVRRTYALCTADRRKAEAARTVA